MSSIVHQFPSRPVALQIYRDAITAHLIQRDQHDPLSVRELAYVDCCFETATRCDLVATAIGAERSLNVILLVPR